MSMAKCWSQVTAAKGNKGDAVVAVYFIRGDISRLIHHQQGGAPSYKIHVCKCIEQSEKGQVYSFTVTKGLKHNISLN